jgi:hypothetical protein
MDKLEYERRSDELRAVYEAAKQANEQNPVREQRSKALKELRNNYEQKQNALTAEYVAANPATQTEAASKSSEKFNSIYWSWLWWLILIILMVGGRAYLNSLEGEDQQDDPPAETLPQEERR